MAQPTITKLFTEDRLNQIIDMIVNSKAPWQKPWVSMANYISPLNASTGQNYRGSNILSLIIEAELSGMNSYGWMTFNQAKKQGYKIKKGSKSARIGFYSTHTKTVETKDGKEDEETYKFYKTFAVFNLNQMTDKDGNDINDYQPVQLEQEWNDIDRAEAIFKACGVTLHHGGERAFYNHSDYIQMPKKGQFKTAQAYYSTLFHELTHATGAAHRVEREKGKKFGDAKYAQEELVAEIGAWMLSLRFGLPFEPQHSASYLQGWSKKTRKDQVQSLNDAFKEAEKAVTWIEQQAEKAGALEDAPALAMAA